MANNDMNPFDNDDEVMPTEDQNDFDLPLDDDEDIGAKGGEVSPEDNDWFGDDEDMDTGDAGDMGDTLRDAITPDDDR